MKTLSRIFRARKMRLRELSYTNLGITSIYVPGIDSAEIIDTVHARRLPVVPVGSTLRT